MSNKKKLILLTSIIMSTMASDKIYANDDIYTKYKVNLQNIRTNHTNDEKYIPSEYKKDINAINDLYNLEPKTSKNFEIVISNSNKTYTYIEGKYTLEEAIEYIKKIETKPHTAKNDGIPCIINDKGEIVYSTNAIGKVIKYIDGKPYLGMDKNTYI